MISPERQAVALQRYLDANPQMREEIAGLSEHEQAQQVLWAFEDAAQEQGVEPWELTLQLIAESDEELAALRLEVHREVAEALGWRGKSIASSTKSNRIRNAATRICSVLTRFYAAQGLDHHGFSSDVQARGCVC